MRLDCGTGVGVSALERFSTGGLFGVGIGFGAYVGEAYAVSAVMFGLVHHGVGDANKIVLIPEFFGVSPGDAEAGGDCEALVICVKWG